LLVSGPAEQIDPLAKQMEHVFLEKGQVSAHCAKALESQFQVSVNHARFMTITDLNALLRLQLEHYGFLPLWELLDVAISTPEKDLAVRTPNGLMFKWQNDAVHSFFETFDWWAQHGGGKNKASDDQQLQSAYSNWTREYRRYLTMLTAHGINVSQHLPGMDETALTNTFLLEESTMIPKKSAAGVTAHNADDLGVIAVTVVHEGRQMNFYPLEASGLNDLHRFIRKEGYGGDIAYPAQLCYNESTRQLTADTLPG